MRGVFFLCNRLAGGGQSRLQQLPKDVQESGSVSLPALPSIVCGFYPNGHSITAVHPGKKKGECKRASLTQALFQKGKPP